MAASAVDLCLAADVAADLGVTSDSTVQRMVTAASQVIASYCGRVFEKATGIVEYPAGYGRPLLLLDRAPILSVASVVECGTSLVETTDYVVTPQGLFRKFTSWTRTARYTGNISQTPDFFQGTSDYIVVTYTAGYVTPGQNALNAGTYPTVSVPTDLQTAATLAACMFYRRRSGRDPHIASESLGDWSVSYNRDAFAGGDTLLPSDTLALLAPYVLTRVS